MKTGYVLTLAFAIIAGSATAQEVKQTKSLTQEEVPALIQQSFQRDFSNLTEKGSWKMSYIRDVTARSVTPEFYTYTTKNNGQKVELFYKADGKLDHTKGITAPTQGTHP